MAPSKTPAPQTKPSKPPKLRRLPKNAHIQKRPLLRPPIPSPYSNSNQPKIIYISTRTPFVSAVKRVRKLLSLIEKRAIGNVSLVDGEGSDRQKLKALGDGVEGVKGKEEVILKGTNRAIEKVLELGLFFQGQEDLRVRIRTGGLGVVDDIVEVQEGGKDEGERKGEGEGEEDLPETQVRRISVVEVAISMR